MSTHWRSAPAGSICCPYCHRYLPPEKLEDGRCIKRRGCRKAAAQMLNRPRKLSKLGHRIATMGEDAGKRKKGKAA